MHFGNPQLCATTNVRSLWPFEAKNTADHQPMLYNRHQRLQAVDHLRTPPNSFTNNGGADKQFIFLQTNDSQRSAFNQAAIPQAFMQEPFPTLTAAAAYHQAQGLLQVLQFLLMVQLAALIRVVLSIFCHLQIQHIVW